ncbi:hypothetical protein PHK61_31635 [Actinomycetospora lutea]|uniref:hypothetical protein n=1 Tax=Actinomycetospora lutea TaxID=663604 RepID=UPI002366FC21|nr:hypothetical protein [Actinomycetospora lutea]MDD7942968.1 hypothetical protein [Actinomycetospora lutea]
MTKFSTSTGSWARASRMPHPNALALRDALVHSGIPMDRAAKLLADTMYRLMRWLQQPLDLVVATVHPEAGWRGRGCASSCLGNRAAPAG